MGPKTEGERVNVQHPTSKGREERGTNNEVRTGWHLLQAFLSSSLSSSERDRLPRKHFEDDDEDENEDEGVLAAAKQP